MLWGIDIIMLNIPHIEPNSRNILHNTPNSTKHGYGYEQYYELQQFCVAYHELDVWD